jgi:Tfp pilus assembly protein PilF
MKFWTTSLAMLVLSAGIVGPCSTALAQQTTTANGTSWTDSIKQKFASLGGSKPKSSAVTMSADDPLSLENKSKPGVKTFVAVARRYVELNQLADAEQQYKLALNEQPDYLPALLGYAQLKEQMGQMDEALRHYRKAVEIYPRRAAVHNNLALCYARQKRFDDAMASLNAAIQIDPKNPLYHNNLAIVLVEQGRLPEAFEQLKGVYSEAVAYYNLGYLLNRRGQTQAAMQHFSLALQADPSMTRAQLWLGYLQKTTGRAAVAQAAAAQQPPAAMPQPAAPQTATTQTARILQPETAPAAPQSIRPLPPVAPQESAPVPTQELAAAPRESAPLPPQDSAPLPPPQGSPTDGPRLPGISYDRYDRSSQPAAPLPPDTTIAVRPLPRVN